VQVLVVHRGAVVAERLAQPLLGLPAEQVRVVHVEPGGDELPGDRPDRLRAPGVGQPGGLGLRIG